MVKGQQSRRKFLKQAAMGALSLACASRGAGAQAAARKPNIVLFYSDDQSWGDLGCFGHETLKTPHIDAMAARGIRLTNVYATSSVCTPARSGLLTGRYQFHCSSKGAAATPWRCPWHRRSTTPR